MRIINVRPYNEQTLSHDGYTYLRRKYESGKIIWILAYSRYLTKEESKDMEEIYQLHIKGNKYDTKDRTREICN